MGQGPRRTPVRRPASCRSAPALPAWAPWASSTSRWGGLHNMPGNDGGTFATALHAVKLWGGVLEHPAKSRAFRHFGLNRAQGRRLAALRFRWLGLRGLAIGLRPSNGESHLALLPRRHPATRAALGAPLALIRSAFRIGGVARARNKPTLTSKEAAATPVEFRDLLINLARCARLALAA